MNLECHVHPKKRWVNQENISECQIWYCLFFQHPILPLMGRWCFYKSVDPGNVQSWLVGELLKAEAEGDYVHIIGHIAPLSHSCYEEWGHQFSRIVGRFAVDKRMKEQANYYCQNLLFCAPRKLCKPAYSICIFEALMRGASIFVCSKSHHLIL